MKIRRLFWLVLAILFLGNPGILRAQQNLFNIPSGAITQRGEVFYQHQINVYSLRDLASKQHLVVGLGNGWDAGVNLIGVNLLRRGPDGRFELADNAVDQYRQLKPALLGTVQKKFRLNGHWSINVGTQSGINISDRVDTKQGMFFGYAIGVYEWGHNRITAGPYIGNRNFLGMGNEVGLLLGYEIPLVDRLHLMGDWIIGTNDESVGVLGFMWMATPHVQICAGGLLGSPGSDNVGGIVLELNLLSWADWPSGKDDH